MFTGLDSLGNHAKSEGFRLGYGQFTGRTVLQDARKLHDFRYPTPVVFKLSFNSELHGNASIVFTIC